MYTGNKIFNLIDKAISKQSKLKQIDEKRESYNKELNEIQYKFLAKLKQFDGKESSLKVIQTELNDELTKLNSKYLNKNPKVESLQKDTLEKESDKVKE